MLCLLRTIDELIGFEDDDLMSLIKNIEFCNGSNTFQQQLANKMKKIKCANKIFFFLFHQTIPLNYVKWKKRIMRNT